MANRRRWGGRGTMVMVERSKRCELTTTNFPTPPGGTKIRISTKCLSQPNGNPSIQSNGNLLSQMGIYSVKWESIKPNYIQTNYIQTNGNLFSQTGIYSAKCQGGWHPKPVAFWPNNYIEKHAGRSVYIFIS